MLPNAQTSKRNARRPGWVSTADRGIHSKNARLHRRRAAAGGLFCSKPANRRHRCRKTRRATLTHGDASTLAGPGVRQMCTRRAKRKRRCSGRARSPEVIRSAGESGRSTLARRVTVDRPIWSANHSSRATSPSASKVGAEERTRTFTPLREPAPEAGASANSATSAVVRVARAANVPVYPSGACVLPGR